MRVWLVGSDRERCGIHDHSEMLIYSVKDANPSVEIFYESRWVNPPTLFSDWLAQARGDGGPALFHLNYHRGLHSRWTPERVAELRAAVPVLITFHDTYETQPDNLPWDLLRVCDVMVVHEPCDLAGVRVVNGVVVRHSYQGESHSSLGSKVKYWRQGVWESSQLGHPTHYGLVRPVVGTFGFNFPWKGFDLLCEAAKVAGWGVRILSHDATPEDSRRWEQLNPWVEVRTDYNTRDSVVAELRMCDATAFLYSCANSGTSGAIRFGIAAGKPVLATRGCRQFQDLATTDSGVTWVDLTVANVADALRCLPLTRFDGDIVYFRQQDSWANLGVKYAALYQELAGTQ